MATGELYKKNKYHQKVLKTDSNVFIYLSVSS